MPQHGDYDSNSQLWYCQYWMDQEEWYDIHDYAPPSLYSGDLENDKSDKQGD